MSRRKVLALVGGGTILAAGGAAGGWAATRAPTRALAPWDLAGSYGEARRDALSYALLAPNPHNRQPWLAELAGEDEVVLYRDPARDLPVTDPHGRQLTIGMGCFLSLMTMAAGQAGQAVETALFPDGEDPLAPVARCRFGPGGAPDPLFAHVMARRSHKEAFEDRAVAAAEAAPLAPHAEIVLEPGRAAALREIAHDAWLAEASDRPAWQESVDLLRIGRREIEALPDGIDVGGPMLEALSAAGIFTREAASDPDDPGSRAAIEDTANAILGTPAFALQVTPGNSRVEQIAAGDAWLRLNLAATAAGLALRPVSQALQEYGAVRPMYDAIHALAAPDGGTVQMLGLIGHAPRTPRTPRWPLEAKLV